RHDGTFSGAGVTRARADKTILLALFDDVGTPAGDARGHEERRIQRHVQAERVVKPAGGPVQVGQQVLFLGHHTFDDVGGVFPAGLAGGGGSLASVGLKYLGADVAGLVDAVAEAHDAFLAGQGIANPFLRVGGATHLLEHLDDFFVGSAVQPALERPN